MEGKVVGGGVDLVEGVAAFYLVGGGEFFIPVEIEADHVHTEGAGADGDLFADPAKADDTNGFLKQFAAGFAFPTA